MQCKENSIDKLNRLRRERTNVIVQYKNHEISSADAVKMINHLDAEIKQAERAVKR